MWRKAETPERTAVRETEEELGLQVTLKQLVAQYGWQGKWQYYYLVEVTSGTFGTGKGEELFELAPGARNLPSDLDAGV